jgi:type IV pilus assembly protein PilM
MQLKLSRKPSDGEEAQSPDVSSEAAAADFAKKYNARPQSDGIVGLDISGSGIASSVVSNGQVKVASYMAIDHGLVVDGEIADPAGLGAAISEFAAASGMPDKVRLGIASPRVVIRTFDMPVITDRKEFEAAVRFQAVDHLPMAVDEAVLDYQIIETIPPGESGEQARYRILLVAASRGLIDTVVETATHAGVKLHSIDLAAFGIIRALYPGAAAAHETICYLHIGDMVNVTLAEGPTCKFTRATPNGLDAAAARLSASANLTREHALMWFEHVGLRHPVEAISGDASVIAATRNELISTVNLLANDVSAAVDFYNVQDSASPVTRILLAGPAARIDGLAEALTDRTGLAVSVPAPLGALDPSAIADSGIDLARLTVAAGLSTEEVVAI